jgi:hypothetical protein
MLILVRLVALLARLALVLSVGVAGPAPIADDVIDVSKSGSRSHVRRPAQLSAPGALVLRAGRDGNRLDHSLRGKHPASALPATMPVIAVADFNTRIHDVARAPRPLDRLASSSPRAPPVLI